MQRFVLTLDLKNDEQLIKEYKELHQQVWPEVLKSIADAGILKMEIYNIDTRLFMIIDATDDFSFEKKTQMDALNTKVQEWESLMWNYQQKLSYAKPGEKWVLMSCIFEL